MKKLLIALMMLASVHCQAATIEQAQASDNVIYPIVHVGDAAIDNRINTAIIAEVNRFVTGVRRHAQELGVEVADVRVGYRVGSNEAGNTVILSVILTESNYFKGGAHPATY